ncbi:MAG: site-specific integrase [Lachnospiraceae bacterium]|nr:site-specific integrase [Lachnospiraceae bacterium]
MMTKEKDVLFEEILDSWLEEIRQTHAISTYVKYTHIVTKYIKPYVKETPIQQITPEYLRKFLNDLNAISDLTTKVRRLDSSNSMIQTAMMIMNMAMKKALAKGVINEWCSISCVRKNKKTLVQVLSTPEQIKLEKYIKETRNQTGFGIYLCLYTGMRLGEVCALKWENIHIQEGYLMVCATVQRLSIAQESGRNKSILILTSPKSISSVRQIPFPSFLIPMLEEKLKTTEKEGFLLASKSKGPMDPRTFQYQYKRFLHQAGIPYYNFHTLRHTFATRCITSGMDPKTLSEILGHADIKITMDYYFHSSFEFKKNQIEKLTALA